jgi:hypothetical protein
MSDEAYHRMMTGEGLTYAERQREQVHCGEEGCPAVMQRSSRVKHWRHQHGKEDTEWATGEVHREAAGGERYESNSPPGEEYLQCPYDGCPAAPRGNAALRNHWNIRHPYDFLAILSEGPEPWDQCHLCGTHVTYLQLNGRHLGSVHCEEGIERRKNRVLARQICHANAVTFTANGVPLDRVHNFCYLGRPASANNGDWPALYKNVKKAKAKWGQIARPLIKTGVRVRLVGMFYKAIVQNVLLYGCETWVITPDMMGVLESFHHRTARRIAKMMPYLRHGVWVYPDKGEAMKRAGLYSMESYVRKRQNTVAQYIATRPIYQLCCAAEPPPTNM